MHEAKALLAAVPGLQKEQAQLQAALAEAQQLRTDVSALQQQVSQLPGLHMQQSHLEQQLQELKQVEAKVARLKKEVRSGSCSSSGWGDAGCLVDPGQWPCGTAMQHLCRCRVSAVLQCMYALLCHRRGPHMLSFRVLGSPVIAYAHVRAQHGVKMHCLCCAGRAGACPGAPEACAAGREGPPAGPAS